MLQPSMSVCHHAEIEERNTRNMSQLVMVIDDSPTIRTILDICLQRVGYEVRSFGDGVAALRWLAAPYAALPALVLIDLGLPRLDGYAVIKLLKARSGFERIVIVLLSQRDGILDRIKGRLAGAHAYVTKPFRTQTILTLLQTHLGAAKARESIERASSNQPPALVQAHIGSSQPAQGGARP
jgi:twitching motility two-component system response regulator PilG